MGRGDSEKNSENLLQKNDSEENLKVRMRCDEIVDSEKKIENKTSSKIKQSLLKNGRRMSKGIMKRLSREKTLSVDMLDCPKSPLTLVMEHEKELVNKIGDGSELNNSNSQQMYLGTSANDLNHILQKKNKKSNRLSGHNFNRSNITGRSPVGDHFFCAHCKDTWNIYLNEIKKDNWKKHKKSKSVVPIFSGTTSRKNSNGSPTILSWNETKEVAANDVFCAVFGDNFEYSFSANPFINAPNKDYRINLCHMPQKHFVEQLCYIDSYLYSRIKWDELEDGAWTSKDKHVRAKNVLNLISFFNTISTIVAATILSFKGVNNRRDALRYFIKLANLLHEIRNFNSMQAILTGLSMQPVYRLSDTWKSLKNSDMRLYRQLEEVMDEENNFINYRNEVDMFVEFGIFGIPFFGVYLSDMNSLLNYMNINKKSPEKVPVDDASGNPHQDITPKRNSNFFNFIRELKSSVDRTNTTDNYFKQSLDIDNKIFPSNNDTKSMLTNDFSSSEFEPSVNTTTSSDLEGDEINLCEINNFRAYPRSYTFTLISKFKNFERVLKNQFYPNNDTNESLILNENQTQNFENSDDNQHGFNEVNNQYCQSLDTNGVISQLQLPEKICPKERNKCVSSMKECKRKFLKIKKVAAASYFEPCPWLPKYLLCSDIPTEKSLYNQSYLLEPQENK